MEKILFTPTFIILAFIASFTSANAQPPTLRYFMGMYGNIPNVAIDTQQNEALLFRWKQDGISYKALYAKNGRWVNTIVSYQGNHLPKTVKAQIEAQYPNYSIAFVDEVRLPSLHPLYRVQLDIPASLLILDVREEEMVEEKWLRKNP